MHLSPRSIYLNLLFRFRDQKKISNIQGCKRMTEASASRIVFISRRRTVKIYGQLVMALGDQDVSTLSLHSQPVWNHYFLIACRSDKLCS